MTSLDPTSVLSEGGAIARRLEGYEPRPEQVRMAEAVASAISTGKHLMVEAGTGVGKSFAYLIPAIQAAAELGKKVVVSTHTINLQEQLLLKDIPFLRAVLPYEFSAVLVKGRGNYVSLRRLDAATSRADAIFTRPEDFDDLARLRGWVGATDDGSKSDLEFQPTIALWDAVQSDAGNCLGKSCKTYAQCHYFKARRRIWSANILVVNHALLMTDLALQEAGAGFLPKYDVVIIDEAHTLEAVAGDHLGLRITNTQVEFVLGRLFNERTQKGLLVYHRLQAAISQVHTTRTAAEDFFSRVAEWRSREDARNGRLRRPTGWADTLGDELRRLAARIGVGSENVESEEGRIELVSAQARCLALADGLRRWLTQEDASAVHWVELDGGPRRRIVLSAAPLDVGPSLRRLLFDRVPSCILTSATLAVGKPPSFSFARARLGLAEAETVHLGSPFDYASQVTIHIPRGMPDPSTASAEFENRVTDAIWHYIGLSGGKALVLFTSHRHLAAAARVLGPRLTERGIRLLAQSDGLPRGKMLEMFKSDLTSVIFGTDSFWQGVDVPGEALSNVIITRLPFSVPDHPLLEARLEEIQKRGGNRFFEYQVPDAIIKFKQGFGRLIRSKTDRGIVVILDPRVLSKPYGRQFLASLPACPRVMAERLPAGGSA